MRSTQNQVTLKRMKRNLLKTADLLLAEMAGGVKKASAAEIKQLSDVMERERPSASHIMTLLVNQMAFLQTGFSGSTQEREAVNRFLSEFQQDMAADRLRREATLPDGITLQEGLTHD